MSSPGGSSKAPRHWPVGESNLVNKTISMYEDIRAVAQSPSLVDLTRNTAIAAADPLILKRRTEYLMSKVAMAAISLAAAAALGLSGCASQPGPATAARTPAAVAAGSPSDTVPPPTSQTASSPAASPAPPTRSSASKSGSTAPLAVSANQLPGYATQSWQPIAPAQNQPVGHDIALNECLTVKSATTWQQQGYASSHDTPAVQDTFVFADSAAASGAYQSLLTAMGGCQTQSRGLQTKAGLTADAKVTQTAQTTTGAAWARPWTAAGGISAAGPQTNHLYLAYRGAVLTAVQITEIPGKSPANGIDTSADAAVLATLTTNLGA
jgi:hypothetical protein